MTTSPLLAPGTGPLLRLLLDGRPRTRAELIELSGLARSTVAGRIDALLASGLVVQSGEASSTGGRPPARFAFNPGARVILAIDVGASHLTVALTDLAGTILDTVTTQQHIDQGPEGILGRAVREARKLLKGHAPLAGTGIGLPGPVEHETGRPNHPPIMPGWDGYDVQGRLEKDLGRPVLVDNDVNLMALGEHTSRYAEVDHLLFVKVATGIGAGVISGGRLQRGAQGAAGDLGHVQTPGGHQVVCRCGNTGCLEAIASAAAIATDLRQQGIEVTNSQDIVDQVRAGNPKATRAVRQAGREIGTVLATCVSLLNPSVIVIGGSLAQAGESLLAGVRENIYARSLPLATTTLRVTTSETSDAALKGAAALVLQQLLS